ncbi:MAG: hypothetical protein AAF682_00920 [Planctomycetota bacterium]
MLGIVVLVIAVGATMGAVGSFVKLEESNRETAVAHFAARGMIEQMQDIPFEQIFAAYNEDAGDDPAGIAAGPSFPVDGLDARADDADGMPGQILFPTPAGAPGSLREDLVSDDFDLPKDLNVDGAIDANDHADDYQLLPVRIRIEWRGASGNRSLEMQTLLRR